MNTFSPSQWRVERRVAAAHGGSTLEAKRSLERPVSERGESDDSDDETPGAYAITSTLVLEEREEAVEQGDMQHTPVGNSRFFTNPQQERRVLPGQQERMDDEFIVPLGEHRAPVGADIAVIRRGTRGANVDSLDDFILGRGGKPATWCETKWLILVTVVLVGVIIAGGAVTAVFVSSSNETTDIDDSDCSNEVNPFLQCRCWGDEAFGASPVQEAYDFLKKSDPFDRYVRNEEEITWCDDPANVALAWLARDFSHEAVFSVSQRVIDRFALALVYASMGGVEWKYQTNWLRGDSVCTWYGVECDSESNIQSLNLTYNQMHGSLETSLGLLSTLRMLDLAGNEIYGTIPSDVWSLPSLESLLLDYNKLTGTLPASLGDKANLRRVILSNNRLTGSIPALQGLVNLTQLCLGRTLLNGTTESLQKLEKLDSLDLNTVALEGDLSVWLPSLSNLVWLDISGTQLTGSIPESIGSLSRLELIQFGTFGLTGTIPTTVGQLTNLTAFQITHSFLSGTIPSELGLCSQLEYVRLSGPITGTIPSELLQCSHLTEIDLTATALTGSLPSELLELTQLKALTVACSSIGADSIPSKLCDQSTKVYFDRDHDIQGCNCCHTLDQPCGKDGSLFVNHRE